MQEIHKNHCRKKKQAIRNKYIMYFFILFCFPILSRCNDQYTIRGVIHGYSKKNIYLASIEGDHVKIKDTTTTNQSGKFKFNLNDYPAPAMYKLILGKQNVTDKKVHQTGFEIIYNHENIEIYSTTPFLAYDSMEIIQSEENKLYYEFLKKQNIFNQKMNVLASAIDNYPVDDEFYEHACEQYEHVQTEWNNYIKQTTRKHPEMFATTIMQAAYIPFLKADMPPSGRTEYIQAHYFDHNFFNSPSMIRTNILTRKVIDYLSLYRSNRLSPREQEKAFTHAVDSVLLYAYINNEVYDFVLHYLIKGFESFKMENVLAHIADHHLNKNRCENDDNQYKRQLSAYSKYSVGKTFPDFEFTHNGQSTTLSEVKKPNKLIIFWASWCPHCKQLIVKLNELYRQETEKNWEVIAISLDTNKADYHNFIDQHQFAWINYTDFKGWGSPLAQKFNVFATPTLFLVDKNRQIIAKPITYPEVQKALEEVE
jgi:peroxiredoxin